MIPPKYVYAGFHQSGDDDRWITCEEERQAYNLGTPDPDGYINVAVYQLVGIKHIERKSNHETP